jgi:hypothetical protein
MLAHASEINPICNTMQQQTPFSTSSHGFWFRLKFNLRRQFIGLWQQIYLVLRKEEHMQEHSLLVKVQKSFLSSLEHPLKVCTQDAQDYIQSLDKKQIILSKIIPPWL